MVGGEGLKLSLAEAIDTGVADVGDVCLVTTELHHGEGCATAPKVVTPGIIRVVRGVAVGDGGSLSLGELTRRRRTSEAMGIWGAVFLLVCGEDFESDGRGAKVDAAGAIGDSAEIELRREQKVILAKGPKASCSSVCSSLHLPMLRTPGDGPRPAAGA